MGTAAGGSRVAGLRKARDITQAALARRAGISLSLLSKIETGDRTLTPGVAAAIARALRISLRSLYGEAEISQEQSVLLEGLRTAVRRYDIPDQTLMPEPAQLRAGVDQAITLMERTDLARLLRILPDLLTRTTTYAHAAADPQRWALLADTYWVTYWLAWQHRWMDLVGVAPIRQAWAAAQYPSPLVTALAAGSRAGALLHCGDCDGGLAVIDRAIAAAETALTRPERAFTTGILHLRGMTLAGRLGDRSEAQRHIGAAWTVAEEFPHDRRAHAMLFGPAQTAAHVLTAEGDLGRPRGVIRIAEQLLGKNTTGLAANQTSFCHINTARAHLDLGDRDSAQASLVQAWGIAPQRAKIEPTGREVLRVLISLHRRSNPQLVQLAKYAGLTL
ncbi:MAG TPA: helix-turn-helix transcriptional regulator [Pseudonocardiaceae bacterium]|nr:helix-turn-helix transcriptional regulator [Pseudonocardiaceae bacterium]